jgi:hypothetical protein
MRKRYETKLTSKLVSERRLLTKATAGGMPAWGEAGIPAHPFVGIRPIASTMEDDPDNNGRRGIFSMEEQGV